jgi:hypothetical protein
MKMTSGKSDNNCNIPIKLYKINFQTRLNTEISCSDVSEDSNVGLLIVTSCRLVRRCRSFGGIWLFHLKY